MPARILPVGHPYMRAITQQGRYQAVSATICTARPAGPWRTPLVPSWPPLVWLLPALWTVLLALALLPFLGSSLGWSPYIVRGESMEPTIASRSLVLTRPVSAEAVRPGDVAVFAAPWAKVEGTPRTVVHRVVRVVPTDGGVLAYTRGDGSPVPDPEPALFQGSVRVVSTVIPYLGYLDALMGTKGALILLFATVLGFIALSHRSRKADDNPSSPS